jgi:hypothetical protein
VTGASANGDGLLDLEAASAAAATEAEGALGELIGEDYDRLCDAGLKLGELTFLFQSMGATAAMPSLPNSARPARRGSTRTSKR